MRCNIPPSPLTLFLPGEGGISPLIVCHVTPPGRNRVNPTLIGRRLKLLLFHAGLVKSNQKMLPHKILFPQFVGEKTDSLHSTAQRPSAGKVIIEKSRGGRFLWNRNWDLGWMANFPAFIYLQNLFTYETIIYTMRTNLLTWCNLVQLVRT